MWRAGPGEWFTPGLKEVKGGGRSACISSICRYLVITWSQIIITQLPGPRLVAQKRVELSNLFPPSSTIRRRSPTLLLVSLINSFIQSCSPYHPFSLSSSFHFIPNSYFFPIPLYSSFLFLPYSSLFLIPL